MKYRARIKEVNLYELVVEAHSYKECLAQINQYLAKCLHLPLPCAVGFRFEIESITKGHQDDNPSIKRKPVRPQRTKRPKRERMEV